jgi:uncharacterized protein YdhG (YjbR/CyaY superfamily)
VASKSFESVVNCDFPEGNRRCSSRSEEIRKALPKAEEVISYKMPAYRLGDRPVVWFAGWKTAYSINVDLLPKRPKFTATPFEYFGLLPIGRRG